MNIPHTFRTLPKLPVLCSLALMALVWLAGCGDYRERRTSPPGSRPTISRDDPSGLVAGLVFKQPVTLDEARSVGKELGGALIAVYRTDYAFVESIGSGLAEGAPEPSRFAYVDAGQIREGRLAAIEAGRAPPITGMHLSEAYWTHWEDQWAHAREPGVRFEAMALYLPESALAAVRSDARFRAVKIIPHRRTDSLSSDYPGELLLESEAFPPGLLTDPAPKSSDPSVTEEETNALIAQLKAESTDISWTELMREPKAGDIRRVVGVVSEEARKQGDFLLLADGDPRRRMIIDYARPAENDDPRWRSLPQLSPLDLKPGSVALWGYPSGLAVQASDGETEIYEGFHVLYLEWLTTATTLAVPTTTTTHAPGNWGTLVSLSGNGDKRSGSFTLTGAPALITYERVGDQGEVGVNLVREGAEPIKEGFNVCAASSVGTDTFRLSFDPGTYYLDVRSSGFQWTVVIEEKR